MKSPFIICFVLIYILIVSCHTSRSYGTEETKISSILLKLINSDDPVNYAKSHGINLKDGMVRVVITVDEKFSSEAFFSKYNLKNYQKRGNIITSYIPINNLKELCKEPLVIYIRLPHKFNAK